MKDVIVVVVVVVVVVMKDLWKKPDYRHNRRGNENDLQNVRKLKAVSLDGVKLRIYEPLAL